MNPERIYTVLLGPHISEKAAIGAEDANRFVFKVAIDANKLEVKKAVEKLFKVKVEKVQVIKVKGKTKRNRYGLAKRPDWKKAYVRLEQGHEIDFAEVE
ncbi:50S ribosomal protein L23 [BD1-7 clade bacterium]|uniref:Large ribosomal subunit protein uL23 n=1 Tax=BD1-7 clade bacterium TaxID=2029982 RepID=A0A5S9N2P5_9GAMM|nr:50S ribosomal protein L23 [BD1-7 clade bacterium]CAA0084005.1 50S ribosomal protein L23 [BD1-7 clade bacterium]